MFTLHTEKAKKILVDELGYSQPEADLYLSDYPPLHEELADAINRWLEDRTVLHVNIMGVSISEVMRIQNCHFLIAVRYLDPLLDDKIPKEQRETLAKYLRKPFPRR